MKRRLAFLSPRLFRSSPHGPGCIVAANAQECTLASLCAANIAPVAESGWIQLVPYGRHATGLVNSKTAQGTVQVLTKETATDLAEAFNAQPEKAGRRFRGAPIYVGHPDLDKKRWPDDRRIGKITELRAGEEGLEGLPTWNARGQENQQEGYWIYPSIVWRCTQRGRELHPFALQSVGLTNEPNIPSVEPVTANASDAPGAVLVGEDAAETISKLQGDLTAADTRIAELESAVTAANAARADLLVRNAMREGRVTGAEKAEVITAFNANFADAEARLALCPPRWNTTPLNAIPRKQTAAAREQLHVEFVTAVNARVEKGEDYTDAYLLEKKTEKFAPLFVTATPAT